MALFHWLDATIRLSATDAGGSVEIEGILTDIRKKERRMKLASSPGPDALTGLPTARLSIDPVASDLRGRPSRRANPFAVLYHPISGPFKDINDTLGMLPDLLAQGGGRAPHELLTRETDLVAPLGAATSSLSCKQI